MSTCTLSLGIMLLPLLLLVWELQSSPIIGWVHLPSPCCASGKYPVRSIQNRIVLQPIMSSLLLSEDLSILNSPIHLQSSTNQSATLIPETLVEPKSVPHQRLQTLLIQRLKPIHFNPEVCCAFHTELYRITDREHWLFRRCS